MTFGERGAIYTGGEESAEAVQSPRAREPVMTGLTSLFVAVGVGIAVLIAFFLIYYLGSIANTIYELKVDMRREMDGRIEDMWRHVEQEVSRRADWVRTEYEDAGNQLKEEIAAENFEYRKQVQNTLAEIAKELRGLGAQAALHGQGAAPGGEQGAPATKAGRAPVAAEAPATRPQAAAGPVPAANPEAGEEPADAPDGGPSRAVPAGKPA